MKLRLHRIFICQAFAMLRNVQQCKLRLSPFEQHGVPFTLVVAESDIFPVNVPVARLQFSDQRAFGYLSAPQKPVWTDIVGERGKDCHARTCGTWRRTSASLSAGARPPAASSWCVPNTFPPAAPDAPSPRMGGVSPNASPRNTSYTEPPARKAAGGRLPPARPSPSDGCPVRTRNRPPVANRG